MRKILLIIISSTLLTGCSVENIIQIPPVMRTYEPENVQTKSASLGGMTLSEGGTAITEHGIVWGTLDNPTISDNKIKVGERLGDFSNSYSIFEPSTNYFYRAYGINASGVGYGETYNFTTGDEAPCNHTIENSIYTGNFFGTLNINDVFWNTDTGSSIEHNMEFEAQGSYSTIRIFLLFKEKNRHLPLTGTYTTINDFDSLMPDSDGKVELFVWNYGSSIGGAKAAPGLEVYVENNNGKVSFIFCDVKLNQYYTLNGKFTYN